MQDQEFRDSIEIAVIDPSAPYAAGIRAALPNAQIAVDKWHLVKLGWGHRPPAEGREGGDMVTEVRQRVSRQQHGRRGRTTDPAWAHRRLLLTAGDRLSPRQLDRLSAYLDPSARLDIDVERHRVLRLGATW